MVVELIPSRKGNFLNINGYLYYFQRQVKRKSYWKCKKLEECNARAITTTSGNEIIVHKGPEKSKHNHAPNLEEANALKVVNNLKRLASEHPEAPPAQLLRTELHDLPSGVLSQLPDRQNLRKIISRERLKEMPANPQHIRDLTQIPNSYRQTLGGEAFLLYDSLNDDDGDGDNRILIFATKENLRLLFRSTSWFVDGTFKSAPTIFFQLFAILGSMHQGDKTVALPFVYALLENKQQYSYEKVFEVITTKAREFNIEINLPSLIMTDFEVGIINAAKSAFGEDRVRCCFFHLCQSIYRHIQAEGLQTDYMNEDDRSIKTGSHMLTALAFVPPHEVGNHFDTLQEDLPESLLTIADYFEVTYVRGRRARGRRRAVAPRYPPQLWCQYNAVLENTARTNNISEGWHNRLQVIIGRKHPSMYAFLKELQKEQADTESMYRQIELGQKIKKGVSTKQKRLNERLQNIVSRYDDYAADDILTYLRNIGHNITF